VAQKNVSILEKAITLADQKLQMRNVVWPNKCCRCGTANPSFSGTLRDIRESYPNHGKRRIDTTVLNDVPLCQECFLKLGGRDIGTSKLTPLHQHSPDLQDFIHFATTELLNQPVWILTVDKCPNFGDEFYLLNREISTYACAKCGAVRRWTPA
jgi:hypothetical protein